MAGITSEQRVAAWLDASDEKAVATARAQLRQRWVRCGTPTDLENLDRARIGCLVVDVGLASSWVRTERARSILAQVPVVLRMDITPGTARDVVSLAPMIPNGRVSLKGLDDLTSDVGVVFGLKWSPGPELRLIQAIPDQSEPPVRTILLGAATMGRRRTSAHALAMACGLALRTLDWRLHQARYPHARHLLAWSLALHTMWRVDVLNWSLKESASAAGMGTGANLSALVRRHTGRRPSEISRNGGFEEMLVEWQRLIGDGASDRLPSSVASSL